jgi:hypothetical protein
MMTIQQATGRAITKVETGDYDMMDEVSRAPVHHLSVLMRAPATESNSQEEVMCDIGNVYL